MTQPLQLCLRAHLEQLARPRHAQWDRLGLMSVRTYIQMQVAALEEMEQHPFPEGSEAATNLILRLPGQHPDLDPLLVGLHYDGPLHSIRADDNATGVAALLELAGRWSAKPPRRPVWLVAFDQEEWGMLGSKALARELHQARQKLRLMVSLEMLAYSSDKQDYPPSPLQFVCSAGACGGTEHEHSPGQFAEKHCAGKDCQQPVGPGRADPADTGDVQPGVAGKVLQERLEA
ncbi:MAG: M28 family peptidase, partial [Synechococcaceae cyanobacterium]